MRPLRTFWCLAIVAFASLCTAQKPVQEWLPVTQEDKQIQDAPWIPGSPAIQLYFGYYKDDNEKFISVYKRIKVLREPGKKFADVEIELRPGTALKQLAARTVHPDGTIVEFKDKVFEKTIFKARGVNYSAATFTFPDVTVGSILEYRYVIGLPLHVVDQISTWPVQHELFTLKEDLRFKAYQGLVDVPTEWGNVAHHSQVSYSYVNQIDTRLPEKKKDNLMELELTNIPPFDPEEFMPPEADYKPEIFFYYGGRETASPEKFWDEWARLGSQYMERFLNLAREIRDRAAQATANENDPEKKLRKLYAAAQQIRNLSFERERTQEELKKENLKPNRTVTDVLMRGYGYSNDINRLFVALARAAGFEADVLQAADRSQMSFNKIILSAAQLETEVAAVKVNGRELVLDPGTPYCPFGLLGWQHTRVQAVRFGAAGAEYVTTPDPQPSISKRTASVSLAADGSLKGELTLELNGQDALQHRLDALETDEAGRRKRFEEEVRSWLPSGASVTMQDAAGWTASDQLLTARFSIAIPQFASVAGKRLVSPALLFVSAQTKIFTEESRRYPISFSYPFSETDQTTIQLPPGYHLEVPPYHRKAGLSYADYEVTSTLANDRLTTQRTLRFDGVSFPPEKYFELKNFFSIVQAGDTGQVVMDAQRGTVDPSAEIR